MEGLQPFSPCPQILLMENDENKIRMKTKEKEVFSQSVIIRGVNPYRGVGGGGGGDDRR